MGSASVTLILALLQSVPSIFASAQEIAATVGEQDQAKINAALAQAQAAAIAAGNKLETDTQA